ncbi:MAG: prepilin-type N-terminal cleavage/methylation domain-containing protein [Kiritimatiellia bacterium]
MPGLVHLLSASWAEEPPLARGPPAGFTLVEIILVVVIVGLIAGLGLPAITRSAGGARLREAARTVISLNKYARHAAVIRQEQLGVAYYTKEGRVELLGLGSAASSSAELAMEQALSGAAGESSPAAEGIDNPSAISVLQSRKLPDGIAIEDVQVDEALKADDSFWVQYAINGLCDGHALTLRDERGRGIRVTVEPLTGDITVKDLP